VLQKQRVLAFTPSPSSSHEPTSQDQPLSETEVHQWEKIFTEQHPEKPD
jgi:hypothetical protein